MPYLPVRAIFVVAIALTATLVGQPQASAQSEIDFHTGLWLPIMPDYNAGAIVTNGGGNVVVPNVLSDDQSKGGIGAGIRGLHRFAPTRTMVEFDLGIAGVDGISSSRTITDNDPTTTVWFANLAGNAFLASADGDSATFSLSSDVMYNNQYIGLRDRFNLCDWGLGEFDLGCGFSHLGFRQDHEMTASYSSGVAGQYTENVDTDYVGIDIRSTINKRIHNMPVKIDFNVGIYDMDGKYDGLSQFRNAGGTVINQSFVADEIKKTTTTFNIGIRVERKCCGAIIRPGIYYNYISDMVSINHPQSIAAASPVSLSTKSGSFLGWRTEIVF